jgi:hypothetical protein
MAGLRTPQSTPAAGPARPVKLFGSQPLHRQPDVELATIAKCVSSMEVFHVKHFQPDNPFFTLLSCRISSQIAEIPFERMF